MAQEGFKQKITAILSADVAGYSRLMGDDEAATVKTLSAYREIMTTLIKQYRGRIVDSPGDNVLAEFVSVVDAVQCSVSVQKSITKGAKYEYERGFRFNYGWRTRVATISVNQVAVQTSRALSGKISLDRYSHQQLPACGHR
jgi:adenylate cyclase